MGGGAWTRYDRQRLLWQTKGLRAREMRVLACLLDHADEEGMAWPSSRRVSELLGIDAKDVQREARSLLNKGLLRRAGAVRQVPKYEVAPRTGGGQPAGRGSTSRGVNQPPQGGANQPGGRGSTSPLKGGSTSPPEVPKEQTSELPKEQPTNVSDFMCAVLDDFNEARRKAIPGAQTVRWSEEALKLRKRLERFETAHGDDARERVRDAIRHQFTNEFLRQNHPTLVSLLRHLDDWGDRWRAGASSAPAKSTRNARNFAAAERWLSRGHESGACEGDFRASDGFPAVSTPPTNGTPQNGSQRPKGRDRKPR